MNFNHASLVVSIEQQVTQLSKAQRSNNTALMVSIAANISKQSKELARELGRGLA